MAERRIILLGKIGSGKSATGNTILMHKRFPISTDSQDTFTIDCSLRQAFNKYKQVTYHVFDTPGIADNYGILPEKGYMVQQQMVQYCNEPHVFLLIVDPAACDYVMEMITALKTWFGMSILDRTIVVFTKGNTFNTDKSFHSFVRKSNVSLVEEVFGRRMIKIENHGEGRSKSQRELLSLIDSTCRNGKSSFLVTHRGVNDRRPEKGTFLYAKSKQRESLGDIPIASGTEPPRGLNQWTQRDRIHALLERSAIKDPERPTECDFDHGDVYTRPTPKIIEIHNEDTEPNVQPLREPEYDTTNTSFENEAYKMNNEDGLKTLINHETQVFPRFEGEYRETEYSYGTRPKAGGQTDKTPRKPLQREHVIRVLECVVDAGKAAKLIKDNPLTAIVQLALIALDPENVKAIKSVVTSEEVQNIWSFLKDAVIGVENFVSEKVQEIEKSRRRQRRMEDLMRKLHFE